MFSDLVRDKNLLVNCPVVDVQFLSTRQLDLKWTASQITGGGDINATLSGAGTVQFDRNKKITSASGNLSGSFPDLTLLKTYLDNRIGPTPRPDPDGKLSLDWTFRMLKEGVFSVWKGQQAL